VRTVPAASRIPCTSHDPARALRSRGGLPDSEVALSRDRNLTHIAGIAAEVDVPVNADFASG
jgi:hypothetical protein